MTDKLKPIVKWAGGKGGLLPEILPRLPEKIGRYYEPFIGGGAVFFALAAEGRFRHAAINDSNAELIWTYINVGCSVEAVIRKLSKHEHDERHYYAVRALDPKNLSNTERAARFIFLNKTCFNGLYRVNRKGKFNVPFGRYANPTICDADALRDAAVLLAHTEIRDVDFEEACKGARKGDAVYFDPPYVPLSETSSFTAYTRSGFGEAEHTRLRNTAKRLVERGVHVLLSNSDTPFVRKLYRGFKIETVKARRAINSKAVGRGEISELLISGKNQ